MASLYSYVMIMSSRLGDVTILGNIMLGLCAIISQSVALSHTLSRVCRFSTVDIMSNFTLIECAMALDYPYFMNFFKRDDDSVHLSHFCFWYLFRLATLISKVIEQIDLYNLLN